MRTKLGTVNRCQTDHGTHFATRCAALAAILTLAGCGGEPASKMTSFSAGDSAASKPGLFTLPADQMSQ